MVQTIDRPRPHQAEPPDSEWSMREAIATGGHLRDADLDRMKQRNFLFLGCDVPEIRDDRRTLDAQVLNVQRLGLDLNGPPRTGGNRFDLRMTVDQRHG